MTPQAENSRQETLVLHENMMKVYSWDELLNSQSSYPAVLPRPYI